MKRVLTFVVEVNSGYVNSKPKRLVSLPVLSKTQFHVSIALFSGKLSPDASVTRPPLKLF